MGIARLLGGGVIPIGPKHLRPHRVARLVGELDALPPGHQQHVLGGHEVIPPVVQQGGDVAGHVGAVLIGQGHQRAAPADGVQPLGPVLEQHHQGEGALDHPGGPQDGPGGVAVVQAVDEHGRDFGIGFREGEASGAGQPLPQQGEIFDDAVVYQGDPAAAVGMGVGHGDAAVGGPPGMADAGVAVRRLGGGLLKGGYLAHGAGNLHPAGGEHRDARAVIAPVFQPGEPI